MSNTNNNDSQTDTSNTSPPPPTTPIDSNPTKKAKLLSNDIDEKEEYVVKCHCGLLRGKFKCNKRKIIAWDCNCSDCYMRRNVHIIIPEDDFTLDIQKQDSGSTVSLDDVSILYEWGTKTAKRPFCKVCGILPWYRPRSNPDGYGITLYCVDWESGSSSGSKHKPEIEIKQYDGRNWEKSHTTTGIGELSKK